jgi:hypothetical protein
VQPAEVIHLHLQQVLAWQYFIEDKGSLVVDLFSLHNLALVQQLHLQIPTVVLLNSSSTISSLFLSRLLTQALNLARDGKL